MSGYGVLPRPKSFRVRKGLKPLLQIMSSMITRRGLLGSGIAALLLAGAGLMYEFAPDTALEDPYHFRVLDPQERAILAAIAPAMLGDALPRDPHANSAALVQLIEGFDTAVAGLSPSIQAELAQLFGLLRFPLTRMLATGIMVPWHLARPATVARFLMRWRYSGIAQLRSAYDALHQLSYGAWYGNSASWPGIHYPGPPVVR